jgi:hypothetical protein
MGAWRTTENGAEIDPSGQLNLASFDDAAGLGAAMAGDPAVGPCFAQSFFRFALGREIAPGERAFLDWVSTRLSERGYHLRELIRLIVMSDAFRTTSGPRAAAEEARS